MTMNTLALRIGVEEAHPTLPPFPLHVIGGPLQAQAIWWNESDVSCMGIHWVPEAPTRCEQPPC